MQKRFTAVVLMATCVTAWGDLSMEDIKNMVLKIHQPREGIRLDMLSKTKEPFVIVEERNDTDTRIVIPKEKEPEITLNAIMNQRAFVNGRWMKIGDAIKGYTLVYIGKRGVVLRSGNRIKTLFLKKKDQKTEIIKFSEGV